MTGTKLPRGILAALKKPRSTIKDLLYPPTKSRGETTTATKTVTRKGVYKGQFYRIQVPDCQHTVCIMFDLMCRNWVLFLPPQLSSSRKQQELLPHICCHNTIILNRHRRHRRQHSNDPSLKEPKNGGRITGRS
jgi:hypothetical protein